MKHAADERFDPSRERIAIFSDHHKGAGDPADEFRRCEHAYAGALGYYLEAGYASSCSVMPRSYGRSTRGRDRPLQRRAGAGGRVRQPRNGVERFFGNHDDQWACEGGRPSTCARCSGLSGPRGAPPEGRARGRAGGDAVLRPRAPGDRRQRSLGMVSRLFVRHVWRPIQRRPGTRRRRGRGASSSGPSMTARCTSGAQAAPGLVLSPGTPTGPCSRAACPTRRRPGRSRARAGPAANASGDAAAAAGCARARVARTAARPDGRCGHSALLFQHGCCSFPDGDVTGLEIADGEIRLVRWPATCARSARRAPGSRREADPRPRDLENGFAAVTGAEHADPEIEEHQIRPA